MNDENAYTSPLGSVSLIVVSLYALSAFCATAGLVVGVWRAFQEPAANASPASSVMTGIVTFAAGLVSAALLWAIAWLIRCYAQALDQREQLLQAVRDLQASAAADKQEPADSDDHLESLLGRIREELAELNTNTLLSTEQREAKRLRQQSQRAEQLSREVTLALRDEKFDEAEEVLERLAKEVPDDPHVAELRDRIDAGRREEVRRLVQNQVRRASDLMAVARFDEAVEVAREIEEKHGEQPEVEGLLERVQREAEAYEVEQRTRLFSLITDHGESRQWKLALETAHRLLEKFPASDEAEQVRAMMHTLVDNARIEEVRGLRDRILDLMERRRYEEAVSLAKHVVNNYPETAAAEELRAKMARLEELAYRQKNEDALD
jgi:outer membrane protein assembly factor BamD (BamD/ComL family)